MPATPQYDFRKLEAIYVAHDDLSIRALAKQEGIPDSKVSAIHNKARKRDETGMNWPEKRAARMSRSTGLMITELARSDVQRRIREGQVLDNTIELFNEYVSGVRESLKEREFKAERDETGETIWVERPKNPATVLGLKELMDRMERFFGRPLVVGGDHGDIPSGNDAGREAVVLEFAARLRAQPTGTDGRGSVKVVGDGPGADPSGS